MKPTQVQMFYKASRDASLLNQDFLWLVETGMTREDLEACIRRRPSLWSRYESWVEKLPRRNSHE